jgi:hypothetical protein
LEKGIMHTKNRKIETVKVRFAWIVAATVLLLVVFIGSRSSFAQEHQPKTFSSPGEASYALFQAAQNGDEQGLEAILGAGKEVTSSNDDVEDKLERERFSQKYQEMHRLVREPDGLTVLYIGAENWPFPIPLVSKNGDWYFDSDSGMQEILFRTVGENEFTAVEVCEEFAMGRNAAEAKAVSEDPITRFAENLSSASAANAGNTESTPFHGYYFRIVGPNPASDTSGRGKRTRGLKLVAYPAEYQSSGVQTFVVTQRGVVFEKDLGPDTTSISQMLDGRRPNSSWHRAE